MVDKIRKIVFICICLSALFVAIGYQATKTLGVLPESLTNPASSNLEGRKLQEFPTLNKYSFRKGNYQDKLEDFLGDSVPKRNGILLTNARIQKTFIDAANTLTGYETIPTFFGSDYAVNSSLDAVVEINVQQSETYETGYETTAQAINDFTERYADKTINLCVPDRSKYSENNPIYSLTSKPINQEYRTSKFFDALNERIGIVDVRTNSKIDHLKKYFRTDHHWTIHGSYDAYKKIMAQCYPELNSYEATNLTTYNKPKFYGSHTRLGLSSVKQGDIIEDYVVDLSDTNIKINDKQKKQEDVQHTELYSKGEYSTSKYRNRYSEYFKSDFSKTTYERSSNTGRKLLIIADSFSSAIEKFFTKSFDTVVDINISHFEGSVSSLIEQYGITDVMLLGSDSFLINKKLAKVMGS